MRSLGRATFLWLAAIAFAGSANAGAKLKPVVELFTSQGCSSCPPADHLMGQLANRDDLIGLTFNVDYWDYLGWRDTLAKREYSERQRDYARARGDGAVYTPQAVVNGKFHAVGSDWAAISVLLDKDPTDAPRPDLTIARDGEIIVIRIARSEEPIAKPSNIFVASVIPSVSVKIKRGENRNREITYFNVVKKLVPVGLWRGDETEIRVDGASVMSGPAKNCAVLVQVGMAGPIGAAAWLDK